MALSSVSVVASSLALKWYQAPQVWRGGEEVDEEEGGAGIRRRKKAWSIDFEEDAGEGERVGLLAAAGQGGGGGGYGGVSV